MASSAADPSPEGLTPEAFGIFTQSWPTALVKAAIDTWTFTLGLRDGTVVRFVHASVARSGQYAVLHGVEVKAGPLASIDLGIGGSGHGVEVRVSDIVWIVDAEV